MFVCASGSAKARHTWCKVILKRFIAFCAAAGILAIPVVSFFIDWRVAVANGFLAWFGYALFGLGAVVSSVNFYLSFLRYPLFILRGRSRDDFRFVSGLPMIGMFVIPGLALAPASPWLSIASLALLLADTGNIPWFVVSVWRDKSFWEA